ncbi:hypothetical protein ACXJJ3_07950 [Kribbella sp. WER1]
MRPARLVALRGWLGPQAAWVEPQARLVPRMPWPALVVARDVELVALVL